MNLIPHELSCNMSIVDACIPCLIYITTSCLPLTFIFSTSFCKAVCDRYDAFFNAVQKYPAVIFNDHFVFSPCGIFLSCYLLFSGPNHCQGLCCVFADSKRRVLSRIGYMYRMGILCKPIERISL